MNNTTPICINRLSHALIVRNFSLLHRRTMKYLLIDAVDRDRQFVNGAYLARFMLIYACETKAREMEIIFYASFSQKCVCLGFTLYILLFFMLLCDFHHHHHSFIIINIISVLHLLCLNRKCCKTCIYISSPFLMEIGNPNYTFCPGRKPSVTAC